MRIQLLLFSILLIFVDLILAEPVCYDDDGNVITCKKVIDKLDDFDFKRLRKREDTKTLPTIVQTKTLPEGIITSKIVPSNIKTKTLPEGIVTSKIVPSNIKTKTIPSELINAEPITTKKVPTAIKTKTIPQELATVAGAVASNNVTRRSTIRTTVIKTVIRRTTKIKKTNTSGGIINKTRSKISKPTSSYNRIDNKWIWDPWSWWVLDDNDSNKMWIDEWFENWDRWFSNHRSRNSHSSHNRTRSRSKKTTATITTKKITENTTKTVPTVIKTKTIPEELLPNGSKTLPCTSKIVPTSIQTKSIPQELGSKTLPPTAETTKNIPQESESKTLFSTTKTNPTSIITTTIPYPLPTDSSPNPNDPYSNDPYSNDPYSNDPYSNDPYSNDPYSNDPYSNDPYTNDPYSNDQISSPKTTTTTKTIISTVPKAPPQITTTTKAIISTVPKAPPQITTTTTKAIISTVPKAPPQITTTTTKAIISTVPKAPPKPTTTTTKAIISTVPKAPPKPTTTTTKVIISTAPKVPPQITTTTKSIISTMPKAPPPKTTATKTIITSISKAPPIPTIAKSTTRIQPITTTTTTTYTTTLSPISTPIVLKKKPFALTGFNKCSSEQAEKLKNIIPDLQTYKAAGLQVASSDDSIECNNIFLKYFKSESVRPRVLSVLNSINDMESAEAYCESADDPACSDNAIAWTYQNSKEFHVCPNFFDDVWHGTIEKHTSEAASIILHELTHCFGTDDFAYGENQCKDLYYGAAAENADTYRLFSMQSIYYINNKNCGIKKYNPEERIDFRVVPFKDKIIIRANNKNEEQGNNEN